MTRVFIWKNNSPQEWEEISFSAFSKARRNGCFTGRYFVETVKMFRDEDDRIIMECSRKDFEKYQQEDRHSRYLQEHEKSRSIFPASHVEIVTAQRKVIRIQICLWMNLLILAGTSYSEFNFLRIYTKLY